MNKKDVDELLERHKRQLLAMEGALNAEQKRQMKKMQEKMQGKNQEEMKKKMERQIKMAEIEKQKKAQLEKTRSDAIDHNELEQHLAGQPNVRLEVAMQKVNMQSKMAYKQGYSRPVRPKKHLIKLRELNDFLGRYLLKEVVPDVESVSSHSSAANQEIEGVIKANKEKITYKKLLDHIQVAQKNYDQIRTKQYGGQIERRSTVNSAMGRSRGDSQSQRSGRNSVLRPRSNYSKF